MTLTKIISGGQTGADQGALHGASIAGLETGGTAPKGYWTENGENAQLLRHYGLTESQSPSYKMRTCQCILDADATLIFGDITSPGSALTVKTCCDLNKPYIVIPYISGALVSELKFVLDWLKDNGVEVLNVAGNRESKNPGIHVAVKDFVIALVKELRKEMS